MVVERNPVRSASPQIEVEIIRPPFCALISKATNFSFVKRYYCGRRLAILTINTINSIHTIYVPEWRFAGIFSRRFNAAHY
jgi:hypothetical protein